MVLALAFVFAASPAAPWEGEAFAAPAAEMRRAADALPVPTGTPSYEKLYEETTVRYDASHRETYSYRRVLLVRSQNAVDGLSQAYAAWSPWHQEKPRLRARVITPAGIEAPLQVSTLTEVPVPGGADDVYTDQRAIAGPMPTLQVGSILEMETTWVDTTAFFAAGVAREYPLGTWMPTRRVRLTVEAPAAVPLRLELRESDAKAVRKEKGGVVTWTIDHKPAVVEWEPEGELARPRAMWSTGKDWAAIAAAYAKSVDERIASGTVAAPGGLAGLSREETVARLLAHVHARARYTGVEFGEAAIIPAAPSEVLSRGFGDCKDKATLLVAFLRAAGFPADVALVNAGETDYVDEKLPGLAFNHAIVRVGGAPEIWVDPTYEFARAGELPLDDRGRLALVVSPSTRALVRTPIAAAVNRIAIVRDVTFPPFGPARIVESSSYHGSQDLMMRTSWAATSTARMKEYFEKSATHDFTPVSARAETPDVRDLLGDLRVRVTAEGSQRATTNFVEASLFTDPQMLFSLVPPGILTRGETDRRGSWRPTEPSTVEIDYLLTPPDGYAMAALPSAESRRFGTASFTFAPSREGEKVRLRWVFSTGAGPLAAADVDALRKFRNEIKPGYFAFEHTAEQLLGAGKITESLKELRALRSRHPDQALIRSRTARALLQGGLGAAARDEARAAAKMSPDDALVHSLLGGVLMHDLLGRNIHVGMDRAGALAAYRRAAELEPKEATHHRGIGLLVRLEDDGTTSNDAARITEALPALRKSFELAPDGGYYDALYVDGLFRLGMYEEIRSVTAKTPVTQFTGPYLIASAAVEKDSEAALVEARRWSRTISRDAALERAAVLLTETRRYALAAALVSELAVSSTGAQRMELQTRSRLLSGLKPAQLRDAKTPEDFSHNLTVRMLRGDLKEKDLLALLPKRAIPKSDEDQSAGNDADIVRSMARRAGMGSVSSDVLADLVASLAEIRSEGDENGWRIRMTFPSPQGTMEETAWFLVKEGRSFALIPALATMTAKESARLAKAGKLEAARRWMDWTVAQLAKPGADPGEGPPVAHFWRAGMSASATKDDVALAAALHLRDADSLPVLKRAFDAAETRRAVFIGRAYVQALRDAKKIDEALAVADRLAKLEDGADSAFLVRVNVLRVQEKYDESLALVEAELAKRPKEEWIRDQLISVLASKGDLRRIVDIRREQARSVSSSGLSLNNLAWHMLILGDSPQEAATWAEKSCSAYRYEDSASLHTLAVAYAETGRPVQARDALIASLDKAQADVLRPHDWYVVGRIAESYGVLDVAREAYANVRETPERDAKPDSTWNLARRRLDVLK